LWHAAHSAFAVCADASGVWVGGLSRQRSRSDLAVSASVYVAASASSTAIIPPYVSQERTIRSL